MEPLIQMNKFEIVDMPGMNTLAFVVEKNEFEYEKGNSLLSLQKLDSINVEENGRIKKTFNVLKDGEDNNLIVLLTLTTTKAIISTGELNENGFVATETNVPLSYGTLFNQDNVEYKQVNYTPNMKRHFAIIDTQTGEEIRPSLYTDSVTGEIKGRCKILPNKPYIVLELKFEEEGE